MKAKEIKNLKIGDKVRWPQGANGCTQADGVVEENPYGGLLIKWNDPADPITHISDSPAMKFIEVLK